MQKNDISAVIPFASITEYENSLAENNDLIDFTSVEVPAELHVEDLVINVMDGTVYH